MSVQCVIRVLGLLAVAGLGVSAASAADLRVAPVRAPLAYDWSGFYIGGNAGYGWGRLDWTDQTSGGLFPDYLPGEGFSNRISGVLGGGQIGFNYQAGTWLIGVEAILDASALKGSQLSDTPFGAGDDNFDARIESLALLTARVGYSFDNLLAYAKAGVALAHVKASISDSAGASKGSGSASAWRAGPTFGVGLEYGLTPQVSVALEYDYFHLRSATYELGGSTANYAWDIEARSVNLILAKLNYRFSWSH